MAVAASLDEQSRPWASLLTGPPAMVVESLVTLVER